MGQAACSAGHETAEQWCGQGVAEPTMLHLPGARIGRYASAIRTGARDVHCRTPTKSGEGYRGFGGGGLGTPVVSYAPLPKLTSWSHSLTIIVDVMKGTQRKLRNISAIESR